MIWYNKDTATGVRTIDRPDDWPNPKNNFTKVSPGAACVVGHVKCAWNDGNQEWDIDSITNDNYLEKQVAIQSFVNSPFNNITIEQAGAYIDHNVNDLVSAKATMKKTVEFIIGLREVLRETIKNN